MSNSESLFQKAWTPVVNPGQDERLAFIMAAIGKQLRDRTSAFDLDDVIRPIECTSMDVDAATKAYYDRLLMKFWDNGIPDDKRKKTLAFVAERLRLNQHDVAKRNKAVAATYFGSSLAKVLADGVITDQEMDRLSKISSFVGKPPHEFLRQHLLVEGVGFLRGVFADATATGMLDPQLWSHLLESSRKIGLTSRELSAAVSPMTKSFAEHVLADTKADGVLTGKEESYLNWLIETFEIDASFQAYVRQEISLLKERTKIASGKLTPIAPPPADSGIHLHADEVPYFSGTCTLRLIKKTKTGPRSDDHKGTLVLSERRLLFQSETKPASVPYRSIMTWGAAPNRISISVEGKPEIHFLFATDQLLLGEKFDALIRKDRPTPKSTLEEGPGRNIPKEVRQRVWQRYGGNCVQCGAIDFLEFAHIVPLSQGGSHTDQNVQLLCRRCLLKASDTK